MTTDPNNGQALTPRSIREPRKINAAGYVLRFELSNGKILLRRVGLPKKSLIWHMRRLRGVKIEHSRETVREIQL